MVGVQNRSPCAAVAEIVTNGIQSYGAYQCNHLQSQDRWRIGGSGALLPSGPVIPGLGTALRHRGGVASRESALFSCFCLLTDIIGIKRQDGGEKSIKISIPKSLPYQELRGRLNILSK